jgi:hypothetical protein
MPCKNFSASFRHMLFTSRSGNPQAAALRLGKIGVHPMAPNLVEVLLPVRTPAPWLEETLLGLTGQSYEHFSLRVLLHGADEAPIDLIRKLFPDAIIDRHSDAISFSEMLNLGLRMSTAKYIARIDADDVPLPTRLESQLRLMSENSWIQVVASSVELIDTNGDSIGKRELPSGSGRLLRRMRWKNVIAHPSVMFDRQLVLDIGGYSAEARHAEDYDLWLRLAAVTDIEPQVESLTLYRVHSSQISRTKSLGKSCTQRIAQSRLALARSRNESVPLAWIRQVVWMTPQIIRRFTRK